jgi:hypothetical protein
MVSRFLLHGHSDMSIGGVSGERNFGIGGRVLERHRCCQEAFCLLEGMATARYTYGSTDLQSY